MAVVGTGVLQGMPSCLVKADVLSEEVAIGAQDESKKKNVPFINYIIEHKLAAAADIAWAASKEFGIPFLDLSLAEIDNNVVKLVDVKLIKKHGVLPLLKRSNRLYLAIHDPMNVAPIDDIKFSTNFNVEPILVECDKLAKIIEETFDRLDGNLSDILPSDDDLDNLDIEAEGPEPNRDTTESQIEQPVVRFVNKILLDAVNKGASDIHFEPYEKTYRIRYRQDGMLHEVTAPPVNLSQQISARIKVMARMDIAERRVPQDGRIKIMISKHRAIDFRVNSCPTLHGEKMVLRLLDPAAAKLGIEALGFDEAQRKAFLTAINKPYGMILVTGPTGSGKTVTLYTALNILNTVDRNISTAEDPVEIGLPGVNQVNINTKTGLVFAEALRAFLRQDPDVIMVGEIRDLETAEIGVKAAQTGHMVLSTLHTNDAPQTLSRLANMGLPPYNIASAVNLIMAQRLARRLCEHCKKPLSLPRQALIDAGFRENEIDSLKIYGPIGCDKCTGGYKGRVGIFQVMPISETMGQIIMAGGNALQLSDQAKAEGILDLRASGLNKIRAGVTSLDEINRVTID